MSAEITQAAYAILARREHSAVELKNKLRQKAFIDAEINEVLDKLQSANLQSDSRYAESLVRSRINRGYGLGYIKQELYHKGVCDNVSVQVLNELAINWFDVASDSYHKKYQHRPISDDKEKAKRMRFMQSRGFNFEQIMTLIND